MIEWKTLEEPELDDALVPVMYTDETMKARKEKTLVRMREEGFDALIIYADLEHGSNFEYLCGFLPRFEEALLILHSNGEAHMVLGNENLNKASKARLEVTAVHMPHFSLPNQPMENNLDVKGILAKTKITKAAHIGLVGWKNFTSRQDNNAGLYELPYYIVDAVKQLCTTAEISNAAYLFIGNQGIRTTNNSNEIAHYEFGAAVAGNGIMNAMNAIEEGAAEMQLASKLESYGQHNSVVTIMSTGERFQYANLYPTEKQIQKGDAISMTIGYKGGLQSRSGYAAFSEEELPKEQHDYLDRVAKPYFNAVRVWLEHIHIGMSGNEMYDMIETVLPQEQYGWSLNPGHLCADEEWMSSPIYKGSQEHLKSGMLFQIDIIPSVSGYAGISCESGIVLADEALRTSIAAEYPNLWKRMEKRRKYMIERLGIKISEEVLPTSCATAYCRPFLLAKDKAFVITDK